MAVTLSEVGSPWCGVVCSSFFSDEALCSLRPMKEGSSDRKLLGRSCSYLHMTVMIKLLKSKCQGPEECWCPDGPCLNLLESLQKHKEINVWSQKLYLGRQGLLSLATEAQQTGKSELGCSWSSSKPLPGAGHLAQKGGYC